MVPGKNRTVAILSQVIINSFGCNRFINFTFDALCLNENEKKYIHKRFNIFKFLVYDAK